MVEDGGYRARLSLLAGQVHHFSATPPMSLKMASRPGAAPGKLSFGDSAAQAGARLVLKLVRLPGIAPGLPPWRGGILLLNHSREIKRAGSIHAPGPCHFNKEQTPLAILLDTNPRFHGGCFGV
jgi:hypothetical protein